MPKALDQCEQLREERPTVAIVDRGYKGSSRIGGTEILLPKPPKKNSTEYEKKKAKARFRRRAAIEPVIGHLKTDNRLSKNFLKGVFGDEINVMLAAAAFNLRKWMRKAETFFGSFYKSIEIHIYRFLESVLSNPNLKMTF